MLGGFFSWLRGLFHDPELERSLAEIDEIRKLEEPELSNRAALVIERFGVLRSGAVGPEVERRVRQLRGPLRKFFEKYSDLTFDGIRKPLSLDRLAVARMENGNTMMVIGESDDEGLFHAVALGFDDPEVVEICADVPLRTESGSVNDAFAHDDAARNFAELVLFEELSYLWSQEER